jgi:hypothetical protein
MSYQFDAFLISANVIEFAPVKSLVEHGHQGLLCVRMSIILSVCSAGCDISSLFQPRVGVDDLAVKLIFSNFF